MASASASASKDFWMSSARQASGMEAKAGLTSENCLGSIVAEALMQNKANQSKRYF